MTINKALEKIDEMIKREEQLEVKAGKALKTEGSIRHRETAIRLLRAKSLAEQAIQEDRERILSELRKFQYDNTGTIHITNVIKIVKGEKVE